MDAMIENVRNSLEVSVRKMLTGAPKKGSLMSQADNNKPTSKIFGASLRDICHRESDTVPFVVKDICTFIEHNHISSEGIFRLSASSSQTAKLREAFDRQHSFSSDRFSVCKSTEIDGHTAANVLKQFLRQLTEPLIPEEVLQIQRGSQCISDESFATTVRSCMNSWPAAHRCTLQYLLSFLQLVMRDVDNRMSLTGLAVVFGPNVFRISNGIEGLEIQTLANRVVERLLLTSDIICDKLKDDQGYLNMTSATSLAVKPARLAPAIPKQARPLPPPPIPSHGAEAVVARVITSSPPVPSRSESLNRSLESGDFCFNETGDSENSYIRSSEDETIVKQLFDGPSPGNEMVDNTIRHVVSKHLFSVDSSPSSSCHGDSVEPFPRDSDDDDIDTSLLPSLTAGRISGPNNRRKPTRHQRYSGGEENSEVTQHKEVKVPVPMPRKNAVTKSAAEVGREPSPTVSESNGIAENTIPITVVTIASTTVTTPDSGCLTADDDFPQRAPPVDDDYTVFIPKLDLKGTVDEDGDDVIEVVPPLDLSEVTQFDEVPRQFARKDTIAPTKTKKRRRKGHTTSPVHRTSPKVYSEPIDIPVVTNIPVQHESDELSTETSPREGSARWRDAWSTDDDTVPMMSVMENVMRHNNRYVHENEDVELAPSSPENHMPRHHSHHTHHHKRHHSHDNHISRPKLTNSLKETKDDHVRLYASLQEILDCLDVNRRETARPEDLTLMTRDQIRMEKLAMQRELLKHEDRHGRPSTKQEKEIMRTVYERYRTVKRLMVDTLSPPFNTALNRRFDDFDKDYDVMQHTEEFAVTQMIALAPPDGKLKPKPSELHYDSNVHISADLSINELRKQQREAKVQKKRVRRKLRDFEREIEQQHGRAVNQADRVVMATEYGEYRDLKAKLRLLEALIEKHNAQERSF